MTSGCALLSEEDSPCIKNNTRRREKGGRRTKTKRTMFDGRRNPSRVRWERSGMKRKEEKSLVIDLAGGMPNSRPYSWNREKSEEFKGDCKYPTL